MTRYNTIWYCKTVARKTKSAAVENGSIAFRMKMPRELHASIKAMASEETREIQNMIVVLLQEGVQLRRIRRVDAKGATV